MKPLKLLFETPEFDLKLENERKKATRGARVARKYLCPNMPGVRAGARHVATTLTCPRSAATVYLGATVRVAVRDL